MLTGKKVIVFDMDGTLIDSIGVWNAVDAELIGRIGGQIKQGTDLRAQRDEALKSFSTGEDQFLAYCGFLGEKYLSAMDRYAIRDLRYEISARFVENSVDLKPGAEKLVPLLKARGYKLAIASATRRSNMEIYLKKNPNMKKIDFSLFDLILTRDDVKEAKPDPECYLRILAHFGVSPLECLALEDSLIGLSAAEAAGIDVAVMYDQYSAGDRAELVRRSKWQIINFYDMIQRI